MVGPRLNERLRRYRQGQSRPGSSGGSAARAFAGLRGRGVALARRTGDEPRMADPLRHDSYEAVEVCQRLPVSAGGDTGRSGSLGVYIGGGIVAVETLVATQVLPPGSERLRSRTFRTRSWRW